jgi:hypothetical protein
LVNTRERQVNPKKSEETVWKRGANRVLKKLKKKLKKKYFC